MENQEFTDNQIISYLLGELSEPQRTEFEQHYFSDDRLFERLRVSEDELIDSYLRKSLPEGQRKMFEQHFMASPAQRERVQLAVALMKGMQGRQGLEKPAPPAAAK